MPDAHPADAAPSEAVLPAVAPLQVASASGPGETGGSTLAEVLAAWSTGSLRGEEADRGLLDDLRGELELAASTYPLPAGAPTLRVTKATIGDLLRCEGLAAARVSGASGPPVDDEPLTLATVRGRLVDVLASARVLGGPEAALSVDRARALLAADDAVSSAAVEAVIDGLGPREREALAAEVETGVASLVAGWGAFDGGWWPRTQERVAVRLADATVVCSARVDVVVGGPPTDRPAVPIEVKSRPIRDADVTDLHHYALLLALRDGRAPIVAAVASPVATQALLVTPATLTSAAMRLARATESLALLVAGRPASRTPGWWCRRCPMLSECPVGAVPGGADGR